MAGRGGAEAAAAGGGRRRPSAPRWPRVRLCACCGAPWKISRLDWLRGKAAAKAKKRAKAKSAKKMMSRRWPDRRSPASSGASFEVSQSIDTMQTAAKPTVQRLGVVASVQGRRCALPALNAAQVSPGRGAGMRNGVYVA